MKDEHKEDKILPIVKSEDIGNLIYNIRGEQVMLDSDLAMLYGYELKALNQQVKRNINRFPDDFMFQLNQEEIPFASKSQIVTLNENGNKRGTNIKKMPFAFTEQGVYMLATVLRGEVAEQQSIFIMRAFREMRHYIQQNRQFVTRNELKLLKDEFTEKQEQTDSQIQEIRESIDKINENFILDAETKNFVIYKGQKFEADKAYIDIYRKAKKSIYVIDDYVNYKTLEHLSQKKKGVSVLIFTENKHGSNGFLTSSQVADFNSEFPALTIKPNPDCHDRFIVLDYKTSSERLYSCGASSKDAGKKVCAINEIGNTSLIYPVIEALLLNPDKDI